MSLMYTVGHKDLRSNIETCCSFFGSFITFEQINDYEMIPEYQVEINIYIYMQHFALRHMTFCLELWKAKCAILCLFSSS